MKIAFPVLEPNMDSSIDPRFGRAACFLLFDEATGTWETVDNEQNLHAAQGAGIQAAETVARHGAEVLIAGHCGPKAFRTLSAAGISVYHFEGSVKQALEAFRSKALEPLAGPNVEGHW